jgi:hypothetical protein
VNSSNSSVSANDPRSLPHLPTLENTEKGWIVPQISTDFSNFDADILARGEFMGRILSRLATAPGPLFAAYLAIAAATNGDLGRLLTAQNPAAVTDVSPHVALRVPHPQNIPNASQLQRFRIPADSLLVLQSLDLTGRRHRYQLRTSQPEKQISLPSSAGHNNAGGTFQIITLPDSLCSPSHQMLPSGRFLQPPNILSPTTVISLNCDSLIDKSEQYHSESIQADSQNAGEKVPRQRRFLLPCFMPVNTGETLAICRKIFCGQAVAVYVHEQSLRETVRLPELCEFLELELTGTQGTLRTSVESHLGEIEDVDGNGLLTIVLTRLDYRQQTDSPADFIPVLGCVRENDFLSPAEYGSTGGDILYLDPAGMTDNGRRSLLSHELSHAAVHSQQLRRLSRGQEKLNLPRWFHEALAHWVEHQTAGPGSSYPARLQQFCRQPHLSPVVQPPFTDWNSARGGTRAAGSLFLEASLSTHHPPGHMLACCSNFEELLPALLGSPFATKLTEWGPAVAIELWTTRSADIPHLPNPERDPASTWQNSLSAILHGTSIALWQSPECDLDLELESTAEAALQVVVVTGPRPSRCP